MIIEIALFDLVDGNRYIPAAVVGRMYREAVDDGLREQLTPETRPHTALNDVNYPPQPLIDVSVVLCHAPTRNIFPGDLPANRARVTVRIGNGFTAASINLANVLFMIKDATVDIIDAVDPPFEEWFPLPKETAA